MGLIPRKIWTMWLQGDQEPPPVVDAALESWARHHPDWEITVLTADTLHRYVGSDLAVRAQRQRAYRISELARLTVLSRYGGVWVDGTCFCTRPLDDWLPDLVGPSGFFAFRNPGPDRVMSSWFLASEPGGYLVRTLLRDLDAYYLGHDLVDAGWRSHARKWLDRGLNRSTRTTRFWFTPPIPQLGVSPYYSFHYLFERLVRSDAVFRDLWERTPHVGADGPRGLVSPHEPASAEQLAEFESRAVPVYKLNWRIDPDDGPQDSAIRALFSAHDRQIRPAPPRQR